MLLLNIMQIVTRDRGIYYWTFVLSLCFHVACECVSRICASDSVAKWASADSLSDTIWPQTQGYVPSSSLKNRALSRVLPRENIVVKERISIGTALSGCWSSPRSFEYDWQNVYRSICLAVAKTTWISEFTYIKEVCWRAMGLKSCFPQGKCRCKRAHFICDCVVRSLIHWLTLRLKIFQIWLLLKFTTCCGRNDTNIWIYSHQWLEDP